ncbi:MAG: flagellin [Desulforhabdus sp.]|jgi:flagellin|nr:flagellin [Desulforhabdus sp.]
MALTINTNVNALNIQRNLTLTNSKVSDSLKRLSSGLRINSAKDDASGLATANAFKAKISSMKVASQNASEAQSMLQTADGAYSKIHDILIRMKDLATQAASGQTENLATIDSEFQALQSEIDRIAGSTTYGSTTLVSGGTISTSGVTFQVGATNAGNNQLNLKFDAALTSNLGVSRTTNSVGVGSTASAASAMTAIDAALTSINASMGKVGAYQNRLQYTIENLAISIENFSASESAIRDVDMAAEVTNFTKNQILQQTGIAMLAQANMAPQQVLSLIG